MADYFIISSGCVVVAFVGIDKRKGTVGRGRAQKTNLKVMIK
jgi:hypothetical protein